MVYVDSEPATTTLQLRGVWIMEPDAGGEATARQYLYGKSQRDEALDAMGELSYYAGRTDPVADYGEHEAYVLTVTTDIPHGPTWREDVESLRAWGRARQVLHVRDNRGRALYGVLESLRLRDTAWGTQATFSVTRADRVREVVTS